MTIPDPHPRSVPVLAFHAVEDGPAPLCISPSTFESMMLALRDAGATALTSGDVAAALRGGTPLPPRAVALTFDDGYTSVHTEALPVLQKLGWPATIFPVTSALGQRNRWDSGAAGELQIMSESALLELASAGWEIGGHTHTHPDLRTVDDEAIEADLECADLAVAELVGHPPTSFAYPYGFNDPRVRRAAGRRYDACWCIGASKTQADSPSDALPRIEAWYLRNPAVARQTFSALGDLWLAGRRSIRNLRAFANGRHS